jgi:hypothetical protein
MGLVWDYYPEGGGELLTALKLADHADHDGGNIWPSVDRIAKQTRQSERTVQYHLRAMLTNGWLEVVKKGGKGPASTTRYRMTIERVPQWVAARAQVLHPSAAYTPRVQLEAVKGATDDKKGATAIAPESSVEATVSRSNRSEGASPTSAALEAYRAGIKEKYGASYPVSAKARGHLSNVIARVGAAEAILVIAYYFSSQNPFYATRKHSLEILARDCERLYLDLQAAAGGGAPPVKAEVYMVKADGDKPKRLQDYPVGEAVAIAKKAVSEYGGMVRSFQPRYIDVMLGAKRHRFSVEELR